MRVLGIETSCDETAAAVVTDTARPGQSRILSNCLLSQIEAHQIYGGVVPEIAARAHLDHLPRLIRQALSDARIDPSELDAIAAAAGPGLIGGVIVGATMAKGMACALNKPFLAVNHLAGHALSPRLSMDMESMADPKANPLGSLDSAPTALPFPYLLLLVSGGHCQLLIASGPNRFRRLGTTIDDALGEAFDKTAKLLGLPYPGGPAIEKAALSGSPTQFAFPRPMIGRPGCDFSFSGLKAAVRRLVESLGEEVRDPQVIADICASFQAAATDCLLDRTRSALSQFRDAYPDGHTLVVAGGVAANQTIRLALRDLAEDHAMRFQAPPLALCTDNAAMIAWAGLEQLRSGAVDPQGAPLSFKPRPRWPLDPDAPKRPFAGVKA